MKDGFQSRDQLISLRPYLRSLQFYNDPSGLRRYPYDIPAVQQLEKIRFHKDITFFVGENGSGKSTLIEAIAIKYGFNAEGGTKWSQFGTKHTHSDLNRNLKLVKGPKTPGDGYFLRAESFYNLASKIEEVGYLKSYGGKSLHKMSHGESFLTTLTNKLTGNGLYIMDEPEAALSPSRILTAISTIHELIKHDSQFIIATHSPLLLAYPNATIYHFSEDGIEEIAYEDTEHYMVTKGFLEDPTRMIEILCPEIEEDNSIE